MARCFWRRRPAAPSGLRRQNTLVWRRDLLAYGEALRDLSSVLAPGGPSPIKYK